jgi:hypothetical protein
MGVDEARGGVLVDSASLSGLSSGCGIDFFEKIWGGGAGLREAVMGPPPPPVLQGS